MLAALASAAMPSIAVAGTRDSEQGNATDEATNIDSAIVQDTSGTLYDVFASATPEGKERLTRRVHAANTLSQAREPGGLGFSLDNVLAFEDGASSKGSTGGTAVLVATHHEGQARPLDLLTLDDCASVGTAIGAIHRLRPGFLQEAQRPAFSTGQIRAQLTAWIRRLRQAGHVPSSITTSWSNIIETEGLWSFATCTVHGGFSSGDILFSGSTITAVTNWQDMQMNDPARDLAWVFAKLDEDHRNAVLTSYGRMLGSRLDDLIMLRANLWLQMEQVGEFIQALNRADNAKIMQFKAQVEHLAHQLAVATHNKAQSAIFATSSSPSNAPSTITVGTLLDDSLRRKAALEVAEHERARQASAANFGDNPDGTADQTADETGQAAIVHNDAGAQDNQNSSGADASRATVSYRTDGNSYAEARDADDSTADRPVQAASHSQSATIVFSRTDALGVDSLDNGSYPSSDSDMNSVDENSASDSTFDRQRAAVSNDTSTILIPRQERDDRALRDARAGLSRDHEDDTHSQPIRVYPADRNADPVQTQSDAPGRAPASSDGLLQPDESVADSRSEDADDSDENTGESTPRA
ncbi:MAG: phosphotransferase [Bifidobacterium sp.]|nr:phosphotransferase [Bifidobacterium sp.]